MPIFSALASDGLANRTARPRTRISPSSCCTAPASTFISVDLPAPLSPTRPRTSPRRRVRSTPRSDRTGPKDLVMPRSSTSRASVIRSLPEVDGVVADVLRRDDVDVDGVLPRHRVVAGQVDRRSHRPVPELEAVLLHDGGDPTGLETVHGGVGKVP